VSECALWPFHVGSHGYGEIHQGRKRPRLLAHRVMYARRHGPIPDGVVIRHTCDVRACVNPDHLIAGTQADNLNDARERGHLRNDPVTGRFVGG